MINLNLTRGEIQIQAYYSYNTGTVGSTHIASTDNPEDFVYKLVDECLNAVVKKLGFKRGNKEAVKITFLGSYIPVYCCMYDSTAIICTQIDQRDGKEYLI